MTRPLLGWALLAALALAVPRAQASDDITIGVVSSQGGASIFVADALGYFKAEGLTAKLIQFTSAAPIAAAAASGDIDFGSTGLTVALCNLANSGSLRIIGSGTWERPGFSTIGFLVSNQAYAAGLHGFADLGGHAVGITQVGTPLQYHLARVLQKYGVPLGTIRVVALQSNPNVASALKGGEIDAAVQTASNALSLVEKGDAKLLGWVAEELGPGSSAVTFTTRRMTQAHPDIVRRFLAAFGKGGAAWDAAFLDASGARKDQPEAAKMIDIVAKALQQSPAVIASAIQYFDPQSRIILADIQGVLDWYEAQGMLKAHMDAAALIDERFATFAR